jgi:hypothetical protein
VELLSRRECPGHDRVAQLGVGGIPQEMPLDGGGMLWNRHLRFQ